MFQQKLFRALYFTFGMLLGTASTSLSQSNPASQTDNEMSKTPVVVMFCDVTNSLLKDENQNVAEHAAQFLKNFPDKAEVIVYPIHIQTQRMMPIIKWQIPVRTTSKDRILYGNELTRYVKHVVKEIDTLYKEVNKLQPQDRSCIINTIETACRYFRQFDVIKYRFELIYISDMFEECGQTPIKQTINMRKDILMAKKQADMLPKSELLKNVHITVVLPTARSSITQSRPDINDVKQTWEIIFGHYGFPKQRFEDVSWFRMDSVFPERFQSAQSQARR